MASSCPTAQLACAPVRSPEGQAYLGAMRAAANYAWCNRQLLAHQAREVFAKVFGKSWESLGMELVYDVAHNIAKFEDHSVGRGQTKAGLRPSQGSDACVSAGPSRYPVDLCRHRPAGDHSGEHGDGELGSGRPGRAAWNARSARPATARAG